MSKFFQRLEVPRSKVAADNPILYDNGQGALDFYTPSNKYFGSQTIPVENKWSDGTASFMAPMDHYHLLQTETFHIASGSGLWYMKGKTIQLNAGDDITIPRFVRHRFENLQGSKEPLVILYRYDSQRFLMEERFFRNTLTYLWDCKKHGVEPSLLQLCVFLSDCWMPGDFIPCPGGDYVRCAVNALMMWILAFVGRYVYGYRGSYEEYYDESSIKKRISEDPKKEL